jgi:hypothetical protein
MNTAIKHASAIVLKRSLEIIRGFFVLAAVSMNSRTIDLIHRGRETWNQCHAAPIAK